MYLLMCLLVFWVVPSVAQTSVAQTGQAPLTLFDSHSHYRQADAELLPPAEIVRLMDDAAISHAVIIGQPAEKALELYHYDRQRFIPFLGLYDAFSDKPGWMFDRHLPARLETLLQSGDFRGIGEIHLFRQNLRAPVFRQILALADRHELPVLLHADSEVVLYALQTFPRLNVIWAHLGTQPDAQQIGELLLRFGQRLYIDTSVRERTLTDKGRLKSHWRELFMTYPDNFLVAIDTFYTPRWQRLDQVATQIRGWLQQLPGPVARKLAHDNARKLFLN